MSLSTDLEAGVIDRRRRDDDARGCDIGGRDTVRGNQGGHREGELAQALATHRGDLEGGEPALRQERGHHVRDETTIGQVDLVEGDETGPIGKPAVRRQLGLDDVEVGEGLTVGLQGRCVNDVDDHRAALDVAQELQPEALALAGAGDEPRDVGDRVGHITGRDDTEVGHQGREGVIRDLGPCLRQRRDETGLAGTGIADERHVGHGLELEHDVVVLPRLTLQCEAGRLASLRCEGGVAEATASTAGDDIGRAIAREVREDLTLAIEDHGAVGHGQDDVIPVSTVAIRALARLATRGALVRAVVEADEGGHAGVYDEDDIAATPAIAPVGTAEGLELLTVDRGAAVSAVASGGMQVDPVDEGGHRAGLSMRS